MKEKTQEGKKTVEKRMVILVLGAFFACILWGSAFPVLKISYRLLDIHPSDLSEKIWLAGLRFFLAGICITIAMFIKRKKYIFQLKFKDICPIIILGMTQTTLLYVCFYIGLGYASGINSALFTSASTFLTPFAAHFFLKGDQLNAKKISALVLGCVAIFINSWDWQQNVLEFSLRGEGILFSSQILAVFSTLYAKKLVATHGPLVISSVQMTFGGLLLLIVGFVMGGNFIVMPSSAVGLYFYSVLISAGAFLLWYYLLTHYKVSQVTIFRFFIPLSGAIMSIYFLNESFRFSLLVSLILVAIAIYLTTISSSKK